MFGNVFKSNLRIATLVLLGSFVYISFYIPKTIIAKHFSKTEVKPVVLGRTRYRTDPPTDMRNIKKSLWQKWASKEKKWSTKGV